MDPCFVAPELVLWPVAKPSLSLQAPNLQAQLLERRGARPARSYTRGRPLSTSTSFDHRDREATVRHDVLVPLARAAAF